MLFYRALLRLYPKSFRAEYGREMAADFAREWNAGAGSRVVLLLKALVDVTTNAIRVHADILRQDVTFAIRSLRRTPGFQAAPAIGWGGRYPHGYGATLDERDRTGVRTGGDPYPTAPSESAICLRHEGKRSVKIPAPLD